MDDDEVEIDDGWNDIVQEELRKEREYDLAFECYSEIQEFVEHRGLALCEYMCVESILDLLKNLS